MVRDEIILDEQIPRNLIGNDVLGGSGSREKRLSEERVTSENSQLPLMTSRKYTSCDTDRNIGCFRNNIDSPSIFPLEHY
ncbi:hypothetical protein CDAR_251421 [Caerostris darwini]|uniref:Ycf1 n=1 Tax=Caerostris darwini TaxID=1538125 RepID=A0AAV4UWR9_9ARAC|nr:hypothetical protein CDAR_251421 [Caerostris darwini]